MTQHENEILTKTSRKTILWVCVSVVAVFFLSIGLILWTFCFTEPEQVPSVPEQTTEERGELSPHVGEIRGVYIATVANINFPSRQGLSADALAAELNDIVESAHNVGFNTIYFQVRPASDALYTSSLFPTSQYLTGSQGAPLPMDPLDYLIKRCREYDMKVVAWVNPYRITSAKAISAEQALSGLAETNPAKQNPNLTVFYDGRLYYNPCLPEVRELITAGVSEILENYPVAGVLYDDYFYPYPAGDEIFDDRMYFERAETELSHDDWRREQVNIMIRKTFETVKDAGDDLTFGVSPFGIWKNASSDPRGSDTRGLEAYHSLYCDALAWIEGRYVDYISPQIYWERGYKIADFTALSHWWNEQVEGTGVGLVISHAPYKAKEFQAGGEELAQQVRDTEGLSAFCGSIQYGFADIKANTAGVADALAELFSQGDPEENGVPVGETIP